MTPESIQLGQLADTPRLSKPHWLWPIDVRYMRKPDGHMNNLVRITGCVGIAVGVHDADYDDRFADWAEHLRIAFDAKVALNYSPCMKTFPKGAILSIDSVPDMYKELKRIDTLFARMAELYGDHVGVILLDAERFDFKDGQEEHNQHIIDLYRRIEWGVEEHFPDVEQIWYGRGERNLWPRDGGYEWMLNSHHNNPHSALEIPRTPGTSLSCSLYRPQEIILSMEVFRKTSAWADAIVNPWMSHGEGRVPTFDGQTWADLDYPLINDWRMGWFLATQDQCHSVQIYRPGLSPNFWGHFVAYCGGFNGVRNERWLP